MKKNIYFKFLTISFILIAWNFTTQSQNKWIRTWDSGFWDEATSVTTDDSCNIYVAGWNYEWGVNYDFIFAKYNSNGELKWNKILNYSTNYQATQILNDGHGNIYVAGFVYGDYSRTGGKMCLMKYTVNGDSVWEYIEYETTLSEVKKIAIDDSCNIILAGFDDSTGSDFVTIKIDSAGNRQWMRTFSNSGPNDVDKIYDMCLDKGGNIYVTGFSDDSVNFYNDILTIKYFQNGDTAWIRRFNGPANYFDAGYKILLDTDKNVFVAGVVQSKTPLNSNFVLLKYDSLGVLLWTKYFDYQPAKSSLEDLKDMAFDKSGNIYLLGSSSSDNSQATMRIVLVKFNQKGDIVWTERWGDNGDKQPKQMVIDSCSNIYITGSYYDYGGTGYNGITLKYDSVGNLKWEEHYKDNTNEEQSLNAFTLDSNNDLIVVGRTHSDTYFDFVTIKYINSISNTQIVESDDKNLHLNCYPNPASKNLTIQYYIPENGRMALKIYDIAGNLVRVISAGYQLSGNYNFSFEDNKLHSGIYFLNLTIENKQIYQKLIIARQ